MCILSTYIPECIDGVTFVMMMILIIIIIITIKIIIIIIILITTLLKSQGLSSLLANWGDYTNQIN